MTVINSHWPDTGPIHEPDIVARETGSSDWPDLAPGQGFGVEGGGLGMGVGVS